MDERAIASHYSIIIMDWSDKAIGSALTSWLNGNTVLHQNCVKFGNELLVKTQIKFHSIIVRQFIESEWQSADLTIQNSNLLVEH